MPTPSTAFDADAAAAPLPFAGWFDSSHDLLRGLMVTEWNALEDDEAPQQQRPKVPTLSFGIERRRRAAR